NDVLRAFIALVGMRGVGEHLQKEVKNWTGLFRVVGGQIGARLTVPDVPVRSPSLRNEARELAKRVRDFGLAVVRLLRQYREAVPERQYQQERIAEAACDLYASSCTLSRLDHLVLNGNHAPAEVNRDVTAGRYFLKLANRRIKQNLAALRDNDDPDTTTT